MAEKESNFTGWLNEKILPTVGKFANTRFVRAVMGAGYSIIAFTIVGSMFLILSVHCSSPFRSLFGKTALHNF